MDQGEALGRNRVRFRQGRQEGPDVRRRHAAAADRDRRAQGAGDLRIVAVLRGHVGDRASSCGTSSRRSATQPPPRTSQPETKFQPERESVSNSHVSTWVPRGFAVVHSDAPGTGLSQGCVTVGDDPEQLAPKAVIDWLNGRAKGFKTADGTETVTATWSTGKVGMTGTSYNGTIPLAAAVTGVKGSKRSFRSRRTRPTTTTTARTAWCGTPAAGSGKTSTSSTTSSIAATRRDARTATRSSATASSCAAATAPRGTTTTSGAAATCSPKIKNVKAAVLMAHAFNDWNVVPEHSVRIYEALKGRVPLRAYYHQGGHGGAPPLEHMNKWFTRYLYGVENGVEKEPKAWIVRETTPAPAPTPPAEGGRGRGRGATPPPTPYDDYPNPAARPVTWYLGSWRRQVGSTVAREVEGPGTRDARRQRGDRRPGAGCGRDLSPSPALRHAGTDVPGAHLGHAAHYDPPSLEQARREPVGLDGRPSVDRGAHLLRST